MTEMLLCMPYYETPTHSTDPRMQRLHLKVNAKKVHIYRTADWASMIVKSGDTCSTSYFALHGIFKFPA